MSSTDRKIVFYCTGFLIILSLWLIICAAELTAFSLLKSAILITCSYIAMIFDINAKRIPNMLVLIMITMWVLLIIPMLVLDAGKGFGILTDSIYGLLLGGGLFLLVYVISKKGLGGGDVKFMAAAGLYLGFAGTIPAILYGTVLAAVTGIVLILLKKIKRKDPIPLAPFLFAGIMISVFSS